MCINYLQTTKNSINEYLHKKEGLNHLQVFSQKMENKIRCT